MKKLFLLLCLISGSMAMAQSPESLATTNEFAEPISSELIKAMPNAEKSTAVLAHDLSPLGMYQAADAVVKSVMILLMLASVLTWAVCIFKSVQLILARKQVQQLLHMLVAAPGFVQARSMNDKCKGDVCLVLTATQHELNLSAQGPITDEGLKERITVRLERVQASLVNTMNRGTGVLATIGSVAPFVGLFGTVWGIMNSFIGIAQTQTTNLAVVAPGIAEALLATAMGLVAAIPAVIIYNHFARSIGAYRSALADVQAATLTLISRDLDRYRPDARLLGTEFSSQEAR